MGGSSGGSSAGFGGGSRGPGTDPCNIRFTATLQSVKKGALELISVGDVLSVELYPNTASKTVGCLNPDTGSMVGTISIAAQVTLVNCLNSGASYSGTVVLLDGGRCDVQIKRIA
jgi:hypothetical protein